MKPISSDSPLAVAAVATSPATPAAPKAKQKKERTLSSKKKTKASLVRAPLCCAILFRAIPCHAAPCRLQPQPRLNVVVAISVLRSFSSAQEEDAVPRDDLDVDLDADTPVVAAEADAGEDDDMWAKLDAVEAEQKTTRKRFGSADSGRSTRGKGRGRDRDRDLDSVEQDDVAEEVKTAPMDPQEIARLERKRRLEHRNAAAARAQAAEKARRESFTSDKGRTRQKDSKTVAGTAADAVDSKVDLADGRQDADVDEDGEFGEEDEEVELDEGSKAIVERLNRLERFGSMEDMTPEQRKELKKEAVDLTLAIYDNQRAQYKKAQEDSQEVGVDARVIQQRKAVEAMKTYEEAFYTVRAALG